MATLIELCEQKVLTKIDINLGPKEFEDRRIYVFAPVISFIRDKLRQAESFYPENAPPEQQLRTLLKMFITGADLSVWEHFHIMRPAGLDIFELKTADLRMFGWVYRPGVFLATNMATFREVHTLNNHVVYRDEAVRMRDEVDLDAPKFTPAAEINNVVSF